MNCWKTVNVTREFGINRIYLISLFLGLLSFIFLYLPFSIIHQTIDLRDHGMFPLLLGLLLLPMMHNLMHILPIMVVNRRLKIKCYFKKGLFPTFSLSSKAKMSKSTTVFALLAPTFFITIPGLIASYLFVEYYAYFLILTSVNIGLSFSDFLYASQLIKAPRKCIVENDKDDYDILVQ